MKLLIIIFSLLISHFPLQGQNSIKTTTTCDDELLFKTPGRWLTAYNGLLDYSKELNLTSAQKKEVLNRLDAIHQLMFSIYPHPMGVDAAWHHSISYGTFAEQKRYERNNQKILNPIAVKEKPVVASSYTCGFFRYFCDPNNSNEIDRGYPGGTGTWLYIYANDLQQVVSPEFFSSGEIPDTMTINGYPVHLREPLIKKLGDIDLLGTDHETTVIIHRNGILPYIPVTRKQYLDRCIPYVRKFHDNIIKRLREAPLPFDDKENRDIRDDQIKTATTNRDFAINRYREELEKTTNDGMLDAPAVVMGIYNPLIHDTPIFVDEKEGSMIVIENPDYMRKDLPKYVPQFFVVKWIWNDWPPQADIAKLIEERFPFEKLQAMIDK